MNAKTITGLGLGVYFATFVLAALFGLPRLLTYVAASGIGLATVLYALSAHSWTVVRDQLMRWQVLILIFGGIVGLSYLVNRESYDLNLTLKVLGYSSLFFIASLTAMLTGFESVRACIQIYLVTVILAMIVTVAVNNTNANNGRLLGPTYREGVAGSGIHHNEVGLLGVTAVILATAIGWRAMLVITPFSLYTALLSGSRGSVLGIILAVALFAFLREFIAGAGRRGYDAVPLRGLLYLTGGLILGLGVSVYAADFLIDDVFMLRSENRGLSSGFTGRLDVWQGIIDDWKQSPLIGNGYGVVRGEALRLGETADGGFLLLSAELGLAGLFLFLYLIFRTIKISWSGVVSSGAPLSITMLVFVITFSFINIFESRFVGTGSIGLSLFLYFGSLCTVIHDPVVGETSIVRSVVR